MKHARLSPSSSSRWLTCTASVAACDNYKNTSNSASLWGTNVHFLGEQLLKDKNIVVGHRLQEDDDSEWFTVDDEMLEVATDYANYVRSFIDKKSIVLIEEQYDLSCISPNQFGTSDATVLNDTHLHVFDLKTGHNIVYADNNSQMQLYAIGAIEELEDLYDIETITLHIVQTRANHISTWELSYDELMKFKAFAQKQAKAIISGKTTFNPTTKGCQWCPHQTNCDALRAHVEETITGSFDNLEEIDGKANLVDSSHLKKILDNAELIKNFVKAVEQVALERLENGEQIDGYKLVESRTNRKWADEEKVAEYLKSRDDGMDYYQPAKLLPMTKILKVLKDDEKIQEFIVKPQGAPTLATADDKRPAIGSVCDNFDDIS